ncbi:MAG: hypothetical protein AAB393_06620 [Bacteroidota bacterium]
MANVNEIREKLAKYLAEDLSLPDFEDWFVQNSWNVHQGNDLEARNLVQAIDLRLSEFSSGHLSEEGLRKELAPFTSEGGSIVFRDAPTALEPNVSWLDVGHLLFGGPVDRESAVVFSSTELRQ